MAIRSRFNDVGGLVAKASPDKQLYFAKHNDEAFAGDFPTLAELNMALGEAASVSWLLVQIADVMVYAGAKNLDKYQQGQLARNIAGDYFWLKISELMLFFHRFKMGRYGRFYGAVDPMVVTCALHDFISERNTRLSIIEQERRNREAELERLANPPITYEEYVKNYKPKADEQEKK